MATSFVDVCGFTPTTGGTTDWTFSTVVSGYQSPTNAGVVNALIYAVRAQSADLSQWEYAVGAYNSGTGTFARTAVLYNSSGTGLKQSGAGSKINFSSAPSLVAVVALAEDVTPVHALPPGGRLTVTSGVAITNSDVSGGSAATLYYTPSVSNVISVYDSNIWLPLKFSEKSLSLGALTANTNYDIWGRLVSGDLALDATAWSSDILRATALALQDGILIKSGDTLRRYLGTVRITGTVGQTEDSLAKRFVWNCFNQAPRQMRVIDATPSWTTPAASSTVRQANANTANQLAFVTGLGGPVSAELQVVATNSTATIRNFNMGIALDSITTLGVTSILSSSNAGFAISTQKYRTASPGIGYHYLAWLEQGGGSDTQTWYGSPYSQLTGEIWG